MPTHLPRGVFLRTSGECPAILLYYIHTRQSSFICSNAWSFILYIQVSARPQYIITQQHANTKLLSYLLPSLSTAVALVQRRILVPLLCVRMLTTWKRGMYTRERTSQQGGALLTPQTGVDVSKSTYRDGSATALL